MFKTNCADVNEREKDENQIDSDTRMCQVRQNINKTIKAVIALVIRFIVTVGFGENILPGKHRRNCHCIPDYIVAIKQF